MPVILGANSASGGYSVANSLRFNSGSSDNLSKTFGTATSRRIFTISTWIKRSNLDTVQNVFTAGTGSGDAGIRFNSGNELFFYEISSPYSAYNFEFSTSQLFRDVSAWYHIVVAVDTTQATNTNRVKIYVNGSQITAFGVASYPSQNYDSHLNNSVTHRISGAVDTTFGTRYYNGYVSETFFIDGQQLTPSSFGETDEDTGIWIPKAYTGSFGTNGFYLEFKDSSALGDDTSGNGNDFTVNNLTSIDQTTDTPTNNWCTINSVAVNTANIPTMTDGNLTALSTTGSNASLTGTLAVGSGKWYYEAKSISGTPGDRVLKLGWGNPDKSPQNQIQASIIYRSSDGNKYIDNSGSAYGATYTDGDIIGVALDISGGTVTFYKNGTTQGNITISGGLDDGTFYIPFGEVGNTDKVSFNFGNPPFTISSGNADANGYGNFEYAVPAGYFALCTKNLAEYA